RILPFARSARDLTPNGNSARLQLVRATGEDGQATDLEAGVRSALASLPAGLVPRIVLVSDGKENTGSITRAAWQSRNLGVPIDTFALHGRPEPSLRIETVTMPTLAFTGEHFPINLTVVSPQATRGTVEISAEGKLLGSNPVALEKGSNDVHVNASLATAGALNLALA